MPGEERARSSDYWGVLRRLTAALFLVMSCLALAMPAAYADDGDEQASGEPVEDSSSDASGQSPAGVASTFPSGKVRNLLTIEAMVLARHDDPASEPLTKRGSTIASRQFVPFSSDELDGDAVAPAVRATLQTEIFDQEIELSGFYMNPLRREASKFGLKSPGPPRLDTDAIYNVPAPAFGNSEEIYGMVVQHDTKLYGAEANIVRPFGVPGLLVGVRGFFFGEQLGLSTIRDADDIPAAVDGIQRDHVSVRVDNRLYGFQAGLQGMFNLGDAVRAGGNVKVGLFNNSVETKKSIHSQSAFGTFFAATDHDSVFAQGIEFNPRVEVRLSDNVFLTAAGTMLWLNNVGEALPSVGTLLNRNAFGKANNDALFYGGSLGLTFLLDGLGGAKASDGGFALAPQGTGGTITEIEERIADLEATAAAKGNSNVSLTVSGSINRAVVGYDDGKEQNVHVVDNVSSRSRLEFEGAAKIARGWGAGYFLSIGIDDMASNDFSQLDTTGEEQVEVRHSMWFLRSNLYGKVSVGLTSPATDDIILKDTGSIMPGAANISTLGGGLIPRHADEPEQDDSLSGPRHSALIERTPLDEFAAGASVDTLRRNVVRYDAPRISSQWGNIDFAVAWGEDDFADVAAEYGVTYNDFRFRFGAGALNDRDKGERAGTRDRREYKGSASLLHMPSGLFGTVAYVHREFHGVDNSDQAVFGENTVGLVTPAGSNRPPTHYLYTAFGLRRPWTPLGDTSVYGEFARVQDAITGLREGGLDDQANGHNSEVTDSELEMLGGAISQNIDAADMDLYMGVRVFQFDVKGVRVTTSGPPTPLRLQAHEPIADMAIGYAGARIKF